ncbi:hypothetical protein G7Y89_g7529 [Cudoniella acicularis]|uniref:RTA1 like protein n=1 Tax=Cudoniella acicularis TaxID=354080 RepID=A0A8H4RI96_9HELO|nr:hypothetical protein G7Y89_g7529 [Cudoniella acicularis]
MSANSTTPADGKFAFYEYNPSIAAAGIFAILFLITTIIHIFQAAKKKTVYLVPFLIGGCFEWIGYATRIVSAKNQTSLGIYIISTLGLLLAPALFAASIYMILGRIILLTHGEHLAPIRASRLTKIFVTGDVLAFLLQCFGGSLQTKASTLNLGKDIVLVGLIGQIGFFGLFMVTSAIFHKRIVANPTQASMMSPWQKNIFALYAASGLILIRSIFRVAEFASGRDSALQKTEVYLYVFDAVLMLFVMIIFNVVHPGAIIGRKKDTELMQLSDQEISDA